MMMYADTGLFQKKFVIAFSFLQPLIHRQICGHVENFTELRPQPVLMNKPPGSVQATLTYRAVAALEARSLCAFAWAPASPVISRQSCPKVRQRVILVSVICVHGCQRGGAKVGMANPCLGQECP